MTMLIPVAAFLLCIAALAALARRRKRAGDSGLVERVVLGGIAAVALVLGIGLLLWPLGRPPSSVALGGAKAPAQAASGAVTAAHPLTNEQLERATAQMRERVENSPNDAAAWAMLAHSYDMLGRFSEATAAYRRLVELVPDNAQVLADYADSLAVFRGHQLEGEPLDLVRRALSLDPNNVKALGLAGTAAFDRKDPGQAIAYWQRLRALVTDEVLQRSIDSGIAEARSMQSVGKGGADSARPLATAASGAGGVAGRVTLSERLKSQVSADDTVFVFARPVDGSRMPVALLRRRAGDLPLDFRLDDSMAMVPQRRLSSQSTVVVGARVSKRGDATPQAGDLQGLSAAVAVGTKDLRVDIAEVVK